MLLRDRIDDLLAGVTSFWLTKLCLLCIFKGAARVFRRFAVGFGNNPVVGALIVFRLFYFFVGFALFLSVKLFIIYISTIRFVVPDFPEVSEGALFSNKSLKIDAREENLDK